ncbi:MAG TPA: MarR family winged helix-turn-helix transcriptional regulator [Actinocrinis sp.]
MESENAAGLDGAGPALFRLVRFWSRRWATRVAGDGGGDGDGSGGTGGPERRLQDIAVLDAVETAARRTTQVAVADVAHQLGLDHSGASRFTAAAVGRGYLSRAASARDSRRAVLTVTPAGRRLLDASHLWQDDVFARLVADWDPEDAARLAQYLRRLADELGDPTEQGE